MTAQITQVSKATSTHTKHPLKPLIDCNALECSSLPSCDNNELSLKKNFSNSFSLIKEKSCSPILTEPFSQVLEKHDLLKTVEKMSFAEELLKKNYPLVLFDPLIDEMMKQMSIEDLTDKFAPIEMTTRSLTQDYLFRSNALSMPTFSKLYLDAINHENISRLDFFLDFIPQKELPKLFILCLEQKKCLSFQKLFQHKEFNFYSHILPIADWIENHLEILKTWPLKTLESVFLPLYHNLRSAWSESCTLDFVFRFWHYWTKDLGLVKIRDRFEKQFNDSAIYYLHDDSDFHAWFDSVIKFENTISQDNFNKEIQEYCITNFYKFFHHILFCTKINPEILPFLEPIRKLPITILQRLLLTELARFYLRGKDLLSPGYVIMRLQYFWELLSYSSESPLFQEIKKANDHHELFDLKSPLIYNNNKLQEPLEFSTVFFIHPTSLFSHINLAIQNNQIDRLQKLLLHPRLNFHMNYLPLISTIKIVSDKKILSLLINYFPTKDFVRYQDFLSFTNAIITQFQLLGDWEISSYIKSNLEKLKKNPPKAPIQINPIFFQICAFSPSEKKDLPIKILPIKPQARRAMSFEDTFDIVKNFQHFEYHNDEKSGIRIAKIDQAKKKYHEFIQQYLSMNYISIDFAPDKPSFQAQRKMYYFRKKLENKALEILKELDGLIQTYQFSMKFNFLWSWRAQIKTRLDILQTPLSSKQKELPLIEDIVKIKELVKTNQFVKKYSDDDVLNLRSICCCTPAPELQKLPPWIENKNFNEPSSSCLVM
jgi:hypothetical protein